MKMLENKRVLIVGVANKHSIAAGIAQSMHEAGAEIALTYQNERLKSNVEKLGSEWGVKIYIECDVSQDTEINNAFETLGTHWDSLDTVVHAVGFAPREELDGDFLDVTTREGFSVAHDVSSYSFIALAKGAKKLMSNRNGSLLTLSYLGSQMTLPNYNVMGLAKASLEASVRYLAVSMGKDGHRVNAISAGPIKTLAASGVKNFRKMLSYNAARSPIGRNITTKEVGDTATFLTSNMASGISGEVIYVDGGFNITAMGSIEEAES